MARCLCAAVSSMSFVDAFVCSSLSFSLPRMLLFASVLASLLVVLCCAVSVVSLRCLFMCRCLSCRCLSVFLIVLLHNYAVRVHGVMQSVPRWFFENSEPLVMMMTPI